MDSYYYDYVPLGISLDITFDNVTAISNTAYNLNSQGGFAWIESDHSYIKIIGGTFTENSAY